ncbi:hypothetical protein CROQUDRAFT_663577, partial [Cronartium quercuum f. sp. fusiforme G11]
MTTSLLDFIPIVTGFSTYSESRLSLYASIFLCAAVICSLLVVHVTVRAKLPPLTQFPGPKSESWIFGNLLQIVSIKTKIDIWVISL